ncbi:MAG: hypothetical protein Q6366_000130 [Candidatus Freyarchaeota archaeon]
MEMDVYWLLFNPLMHDALTLIFGVVLVLGLGLFIYNLILLISYYRKRQVIPRMFLSLFLIGISVRWEWFLPVIAEAMGGITQYIGLYIYYMVYQYLAQHGAAITTLMPLM